MASPFDKLTLNEAQERLKAARPCPTLSAIANVGSEQAQRSLTPLLDADAANDAFYAGDHWQASLGWVGPQPPPTDSEAARVMLEIQRAFVSKNTIREIVNRHRDGVIGREPAWSFTPRRPLNDDEQPTSAEQALIDEAEAALTTWWDKRKLLKTIQAVLVDLLKHERACLRIFVPAGMLQTNDLVTGEATAPRVPMSDLEQALDRVYISRPAAHQAGLITDEDTQEQASVYIYTKDSITYAELSYVDQDTGQTVLRILGGETEQGTTLDLGGQLLLGQAERETFISEQIRQLQKQLNLAKTMEGRNVVQGGFLERTILNAQMPGSWVDDPNGTLQADGTRKTFKPAPLRVGAGRTNFISGVAVKDTQGNITGYTPASIVYRDPVKPDTFEMTADAAHRAILEEAQQLHALIGGDATASGESRKQARADYEKSLLITKSEIDAIVRWLLQTVLDLASIFSGQAGRFGELRASCDCRIDTGPLSGDEQQQIIGQVEAELLSRESAMSRLGVEDVTAEQARIAAEQDERQARAIELAAATNPGTAPGRAGASGAGPQPPNNRPPGRDPAQPPQGGTS
jgi:hypothetical protein